MWFNTPHLGKELSLFYRVSIISDRHVTLPRNDIASQWVKRERWVHPLLCLISLTTLLCNHAWWDCTRACLINRACKISWYGLSYMLTSSMIDVCFWWHIRSYHWLTLTNPVQGSDISKQWKITIFFIQIYQLDTCGIHGYDHIIGI